MQRILGQDQAIARLKEAAASGRLHHAWIFSGPRGVGKFTAALEFASLILEPHAEPSPTVDHSSPGLFELAPPTENLDARRPITGHRPSSSAEASDIAAHPDVHVIRKEMARFSDIREVRERKQINIPLDLLRERMIGGMINDEFRTAPMALTSVTGCGKVFIIDEAELVDAIGQNALLKSLEEPPRQTHVVLVTARPERLLPTIHSRCQHVRFGRLDEQAMRAWMDSREEVAALEVPQRRWVERFAAGAPGAALLAVTYGLHRWQALLDPMLVELERGGYPIDLGEALSKLVEEFAAAWVKRHDNASKDAANKLGAEQALAMLAAWIQSRLEEAVAAGDDPRPLMARLDSLIEAERQLQSSANLRLVLENLPAQWAAAMPVLS